MLTLWNNWISAIYLAAYIFLAFKLAVKYGVENLSKNDAFHY
jgi:hypothetical protein